MIDEQISLYKAHTIHFLVHYLHNFYLKSEIYLILFKFIVTSVSSGDFAHLRIPGYFAHLLQHLKMKENDNSENSMIKNNPSLV